MPELRRGNRVPTLQSSLAIEQNKLSVEQVTAVLAGKPVQRAAARLQAEGRLRHVGPKKGGRWEAP